MEYIHHVGLDMGTEYLTVFTVALFLDTSLISHLEHFGLNFRLTIY